jgi:hypothetical protein
MDCPSGQNAGKVSAKSEAPDKGASDSSTDPLSGMNLGSGALLLALALFLWTRLRV